MVCERECDRAEQLAMGTLRLFASHGRETATNATTPLSPALNQLTCVIVHCHDALGVAWW